VRDATVAVGVAAAAGDADAGCVVPVQPAATIAARIRPKPEGALIPLLRLPW
jgi:hypothetical protein